MNITPAKAYWNQRELISKLRGRFQAFSDTIGNSEHLSMSQWFQISAFTLEFKPDLILELGRGFGNSTCLFTEVAHLLGGPEKCEVVSLCISLDFETSVIPKLKENNLIDDKWFEPLRYLNENILTYDYESLFRDYKRVLVFWDAHGYSIAECVLGRILPLIQNEAHYVIMHDLSDKRYIDKNSLMYNDKPLWRGGNNEGNFVVLDNVVAAVEQAVSIVDYTSRNSIELVSSDHSYHMEIGNDKSKLDGMKALLENDFNMCGNWFCFSINNTNMPLSFPKFNLLKNNYADEKIEEDKIQLIINGLLDCKIDIKFICSIMKCINQQIAIFGADEFGKLIYNLIKEINKRYDNKIEIKYIFDNSSFKQNKNFYDLIINKPNRDLLKGVSMVVIASNSYKDISMQLINMGVEAENILVAINNRYKI